MEEKLGSELKTDSTTWGNFKNVEFDLTKGKYLSDNIWITITNYKKPALVSILLTSGATTRNSTLNIYDLAGNISEWTLEYSSNIEYPCVFRAGNCYYDLNNLPVASRSSHNSTFNVANLGARSALW